MKEKVMWILVIVLFIVSIALNIQAIDIQEVIIVLETDRIFWAYLEVLLCSIEFVILAKITWEDLRG